MKVKVLFVLAAIILISVAVYGQASLAGKWQTDNAQAALAASQESSSGASSIGLPASPK